MTESIGYTSELFSPFISLINEKASWIYDLHQAIQAGDIHEWTINDCTTTLNIPSELVTHIQNVIKDNSGLSILTELRQALGGTQALTTLIDADDLGIYCKRVVDGVIDSNILDSDRIITILDQDDDLETYTIRLNGIIKNSFDPFVDDDISHSYEKDQLVSLYSFLKKGGANLTSLQVLKETVTQCIDSINTGVQFSYTNVATWIQSTTKSLSDAKGTLSDLMDSVSSATNVSSVIQAIKSKLSCLIGGVQTSSVIFFSDNNEFSVGTFAGGVLGGLTTVLSTIGTVIGMAIGGLFGAITAAASLAINGIGKLIDLIPTYDESTLISYNKSYTVDTLEGGWFQGTTLLTGSAASYVDSSYPGACCETPWFMLFQTSSNAEIQLRLGKGELNALVNAGLVVFNDAANTMTLKSATAATIHSTLRMGDQLDPIPGGYTSESCDKVARMNACCALSVMMYLMLQPHFRQGVSAVTLNLNDGSVFAKWGLFFRTYFYRAYEINSTSGLWAPINYNDVNLDDLGWGDIAGTSMTSGLGSLLYPVARWALNRDTIWYQKDLPTGVYPGSPALIVLVRENLSELFADGTQVGSGFTLPAPMLITPLPKYKAPSLDRNSFWSGYVSVILTFTGTAVLAVATFLTVRKAVRTWNAHWLGKAEQAWYAYTENPTVENYNAYSKAAKNNNILTKLTGGTTLSRTSYWDDIDDDSSDEDENQHEYTNTNLEEIIDLIK